MSTQESHPVRLSDIAPGEEVIVVGLASGRGAARQFTELGVEPGMGLRVLENVGAGPVFVALGERQLEIGRGMADKLLVR